jgi:Tol biopolymer transport system component
MHVTTLSIERGPQASILTRLVVLLGVLSCSPEVPSSPAQDVKEGAVSPVNYAPAWSPDGERISYTHAAQTTQELGLGAFQVWVCAVETGAAEYVVPGISPDWSPDGTKLVYVQNGDLWVVDLITDVASLLLDCALCAHPQWSPDGKTILFQNLTRDGGETLSFVDSGGSNVRDTGMRIHSADWSPMGNQVVFATANERSLTTLDLQTGQQGLLVDATPDFVRHPRWSPNGAEIVYSRFGNNTESGSGTWLVLADGQDNRQLLTSARMAAWSPNSRALVYERIDHEARQLHLWVYSRDTGTSSKLVTTP